MALQFKSSNTLVFKVMFLLPWNNLESFPVNSHCSEVFVRPRLKVKGR